MIITFRSSKRKLFWAFAFTFRNHYLCFGQRTSEEPKYLKSSIFDFFFFLLENSKVFLSCALDTVSLINSILLFLTLFLRFGKFIPFLLEIAWQIPKIQRCLKVYHHKLFKPWVLILPVESFLHTFMFVITENYSKQNSVNTD